MRSFFSFKFRSFETLKECHSKERSKQGSIRKNVFFDQKVISKNNQLISKECYLIKQPMPDSQPEGRGFENTYQWGNLITLSCKSILWA